VGALGSGLQATVRPSPMNTPATIERTETAGFVIDIRTA
jgi:hypothetical protein